MLLLALWLVVAGGEAACAAVGAGAALTPGAGVEDGLAEAAVEVVVAVVAVPSAGTAEGDVAGAAVEENEDRAEAEEKGAEAETEGGSAEEAEGAGIGGWLAGATELGSTGAVAAGAVAAPGLVAPAISEAADGNGVGMNVGRAPAPGNEGMNGGGAEVAGTPASPEADERGGKDRPAGRAPSANGGKAEPPGGGWLGLKALGVHPGGRADAEGLVPGGSGFRNEE